MRKLIPIQERLDRRSVRADDGDCLLWTGRVNNAGYGSMSIQTDQGTRTRSVHRVAYELAIGLIPDGLTIDHLCRNKRCINVTHMEVVTRTENLQRRDGASVDECRNGHRYTPENTRPRNDWRGLRICRSCEAAASRRYKARRRMVEVSA